MFFHFVTVAKCHCFFLVLLINFEECTNITHHNVENYIHSTHVVGCLALESLELDILGQNQEPQPFDDSVMCIEL